MMLLHNPQSSSQEALFKILIEVGTNKLDSACNGGTLYCLPDGKSSYEFWPSDVVIKDISYYVTK